MTWTEHLSNKEVLRITKTKLTHQSKNKHVVNQENLEHRTS